MVSKAQMRKTYRVLGLMSGTSLDGIDAAVITTDGERILDEGPSRTVAFSDETRDLLRATMREAVRWGFDGPAPNIFAAAEDVLDANHARVVESIAGEFDLIGYHGQTVLHRPEIGRTLQIGQGRRLAEATGRTVVHDFRSADVAAGGEGAPLAPVYHRALVERSGLPGVTAVLNLGGVGNVTIVDGEMLLASDTGPGNGPLDSWLGDMDRGGSVSQLGAPDFDRLAQWLKRPFFRRAWPKSADRYDFEVTDDMQGLSRVDGAATLAAFTALSVRHTLRMMGARPDRVIVCGGGRHNRTMMTLLGLELGCEVVPAERHGWNSDALEAQAFAFLAARVVDGLPNSYPTTTGVPEPTVGGVISRPG